jgi:hypothetical protein
MGFCCKVQQPYVLMQRRGREQRARGDAFEERKGQTESHPHGAPLVEDFSGTILLSKLRIKRKTHQDTRILSRDTFDFVRNNAADETSEQT